MDSVPAFYQLEHSFHQVLLLGKENMLIQQPEYSQPIISGKWKYYHS